MVESQWVYNAAIDERMHMALKSRGSVPMEPFRRGSVPAGRAGNMCEAFGGQMTEEIE